MELFNMSLFTILPPYMFHKVCSGVHSSDAEELVVDFSSRKCTLLYAEAAILQNRFFCKCTLLRCQELDLKYLHCCPALQLALQLVWRMQNWDWAHTGMLHHILGAPYGFLLNKILLKELK